jgi:two-component system nitrate/nitrite response regulator NarL
VIADERSVFRTGLRKLLEAEPDLAVAGEARDADEAIRLVHQLQPDILLLDVNLSRHAGLHTLQRIHGTTTPVRTILLTPAIHHHEVVSALQLGARGVVTKEATADLLLEAIRTVIEGKYWIGDECAVELVDTFRRLMADAGAGSFGLTRRELKIVAMVAAGRTNRKIAESLSLSEDTVKHHLTVIFDKVGVSSRLELAQFAARHRLRDGA